MLAMTRGEVKLSKLRIVPSLFCLFSYLLSVRHAERGAGGVTALGHGYTGGPRVEDVMTFFGGSSLDFGRKIGRRRT